VKGAPSLNPKGRPRTGLALAETIREVVDGNVRRELVYLVLDVAFGRGVCIDTEYLEACAKARAAGEPMPPRPPNAQVVQPSMGEMQRAQEFLATWGFQKPAATLELGPLGGSDDRALDMGRLSDAELTALEELHAKAVGIIEASAIERLPSK
jgi:hypothetical protein